MKVKRVLETVAVVLAMVFLIGCMIMCTTIIAKGAGFARKISEERAEFRARAESEFGNCLFVKTLPEDTKSIICKGYDAVIVEDIEVLTSDCRCISINKTTFEEFHNARQLLLSYRVFAPESVLYHSYVIEQFRDLSDIVR